MKTGGISPNTACTRRVYAFNANGESAGSTGQTRWSLIQTPDGVAFSTVSTDTIVASASGTFSNLGAGNSGTRLFNTTAGTDSGWQPAGGALASPARETAKRSKRPACP